MTDVDERTEQARSLQTKAKLLAATLSTIHDVGWASASSARIADAAGVSRGAQTHNYPPKTDLLIAAMEEANRRQDERVRKGLTNLVDAEDPVEAYLRLIWDTLRDPSYSASWIEAVVAARTDHDLRTTVARIDAHIFELIGDATATLAHRAGDADPERTADLVRLAVYAMRGMVLERPIRGTEAERERLLETLIETITRERSATSSVGPDQR